MKLFNYENRLVAPSLVRRVFATEFPRSSSLLSNPRVITMNEGRHDDWGYLKDKWNLAAALFVPARNGQKVLHNMTRT